MDHVNPDGRNLDGEKVKDMRLLHVYGPSAHHDEVFIVGNRAALVGLRAAIDAALDEGNRFRAATTESFVVDGEGFDTHVMLEDSAWDGEFWKTVALPYTADWIVENWPKDMVWPGKVMAERLKAGEVKTGTG
jgi:hypothetical protein